MLLRNSASSLEEEVSSTRASRGAIDLTLDTGLGVSALSGVAFRMNSAKSSTLYAGVGRGYIHSW